MSRLSARLLPPLLILALVLSLPGCGWHLRSANDRVLLETLTLLVPEPDLRFALEEAMENDGVQVHDQSPFILKLSGIRWNNRTVAVDRAGRTAEVELSLRLTWQLLSRDDGPLSPPEEIATVRRYQVSPENVTGASDEAALARQDMINEVVARLQRAVATLTPDPEAP